MDLIGVLVLALPFLFILYLVWSQILFRAQWPLRMRRSLGELPPVIVPDGYRLRSYQSGDGEGWVQLVNAAFATEKRVSTRVRRAARVRTNRERILLAEREATGELTGTAMVLYSPPAKGRREGLIQYVGVHPAHRGRRLGEALVVAALHDLRQRGHTEALLYANPGLTAAMRLYERLGFESGKAQRQ